MLAGIGIDILVGVQHEKLRVAESEGIEVFRLRQRGIVVVMAGVLFVVAAHRGKGHVIDQWPHAGEKMLRPMIVVAAGGHQVSCVQGKTGALHPGGGGDGAGDFWVALGVTDHCESKWCVGANRGLEGGQFALVAFAFGGY